MVDTLRDILEDKERFIQVARSAFDSVDTGGSGQLEASELIKTFAQIAIGIQITPPTPDAIAAGCRALAIAGSGVLSFDRFEAMFRSALQRLAGHRRWLTAIRVSMSASRLWLSVVCDRWLSRLWYLCVWPIVCQ